MIYTTAWLEFFLWIIGIILVVGIHELGHLFIALFFDEEARIVFDKKKIALYTQARMENKVYLLSLYNGIVWGGIATMILAIPAIFKGFIFYPLFLVMAYIIGIIPDIKAIKEVKQ